MSTLARLARVDRVLERAWHHQLPTGYRCVGCASGDRRNAMGGLLLSRFPAPVKAGLGHRTCLARFRRVLALRGRVLQAYLDAQMFAAKAPRPVTRPAEVGALSGDQLDLFA